MLALGLLLLLAAPSPREDARRVLRRVGCQTCHDSSVSTENGDALFVYNLNDDKWPDGLTDRQLPILIERMQGRSKEDLKIVQRFIDAELRARRR